MQDLENIEFHEIDTKIPIFQSGPLINMLHELATDNIEVYQDHGGFTVLSRYLNENKRGGLINDLNYANLKGRGGGGFPAAHKWWLVHRKEGEKYFVCNGNTGHPGNFKDRLLLETSPYLLVEAALLTAWAIGAETAFICVPYAYQKALNALREAAEKSCEITNLVKVLIVPTYGDLIIGEETALMELLEGKHPRPRPKPALPSTQGIFGCPTLVNNVETMLHAFLIARNGRDAFRSMGTKNAPGTMIFSVSGHVSRPGLYELPLGTSLKDVIDTYAGGPKGDDLTVIFPAGPSSPPIKYEECDIPLDYESMVAASSQLGMGNIIVLDDTLSMVQVTTKLAEYFNEHSCGQCHPCSDGTRRLVLMFHNLDRLDEVTADLTASRYKNTSRRHVNSSSSQPVRGASLTDMKTDLDKIDALCDFMKYRGKCRWSEAASDTIKKSLTSYREGFLKAIHNDSFMEDREGEGVAV